jgi:hypothetical protein
MSTRSGTRYTAIPALLFSYAAIMPPKWRVQRVDDAVRRACVVDWAPLLQAAREASAASAPTSPTLLLLEFVRMTVLKAVTRCNHDDLCATPAMNFIWRHAARVMPIELAFVHGTQCSDDAYRVNLPEYFRMAYQEALTSSVAHLLAFPCAP